MRKISWNTYKSQLPNNWIKEVQKLISEEGFTLSEIQIRDTRIGKIVDPIKQELVWTAIKKLRKIHQARQKKLQKLKELN